MRNLFTYTVILTILWLTLAGWRTDAVPEKLSDYGFFTGNIAQQKPASGVVPYALNTPVIFGLCRETAICEITCRAIGDVQ